MAGIDFLEGESVSCSVRGNSLIGPFVGFAVLGHLLVPSYTFCRACSLLSSKDLRAAPTPGLVIS